MTPRSSLVRAAGVVAVVLFISKFLGFAREASLAAVFGASNATDAYVVGQTVPGLIFASVGAALGTTFIPVYAQIYQERGRDVAFSMVNSVINATILLSLAFIAFGEMAAGWLVGIVAPGFQGSVFALTVQLTRIMFPMVLFQALSGLVTGILQTEGNFAVPALVGLGFNVIVITSIVGFGPRFGIGAVALGTVLAIAFQLLFQAPSLVRMGFRWRPELNFRDPGLLRISKLVGPILIGTSVGQLGTVVDRVLASRLIEGSVTALNYADRLMNLVPSVFGAAITTVMYPTLAKLTAEGNWGKFSSGFSEAVRIINFLLVPVAVGMAVLRVPLVQIVFQRGAFDAQATQATAWALLFFSVGTAAFTLREMVSRAFFAFQDTKAPMITGAAAVGVNVVLNLILVGPLRHGGLALGTSIAGVFNAATLLWVLRKRIQHVSRGAASGIGGRAILDSFWRVALSSGVMGLVVLVSYGRLVGLVSGEGLVDQGIRLFTAVGIGILVYAASVILLKVPEAFVTISACKKLLVKVLGKSQVSVTP